MRLGIGLAATGVAVTAWAVAAAQDGFGTRSQPHVDPATGRTIHYFSKTGATSRRTTPARPANIPGVRNYYDQLFSESAGEKPVASPVRAAGGTESDSAPLMNAGFNRSAGRPAAGTIHPVAGQAPAGQRPTARMTAARTIPTEPANPFLQMDEAGSFGPIQPTSADGSLPSETETAGPPGSAEPILEPQSEPATPEGATPFAAPAVQTAGRPEEVPAAEYAPPPAQERSVPAADAANGSIGRLAEAHMGGPAAVEVRWENVGEISVGKECRCDLVVKNSGAGAAGEVAVEAFFPGSVRLVAADPKPTAAADRLTWTVPSLAAGAEKRISVTLVPSEQGDLQVSAFVRYTEAAATTLAVREPMLKVNLNGPAEAAIGETVSQTISVANPGSGTADDVVVEVTLPAGLEHAKGSRLTMPVGALAPGQSQDIRLTLFATQGGPQQIQVTARSGETLRRDAVSTVAVAAPSLKVAAEGPGLRFVGRDAVYRVRVTNEGAAAANNVRVVHAVPNGFVFQTADNGGRFEAGQSQIVWYVGSLAAGQTVELAAKLTADQLGSHRHLVTVLGEGGAKVDAAVETAVDGTASLVCEIIDLDDPVEVGSETAYEIRVRNEGTKAATNVAVSCQVPAGVATLSARGPTDPRNDEGLLAFPPVEQLEPGKTALYRVVVKGTAEGKHRFRVRLTSDSIEEPLIHEELTHYYAD